MEVSTITMDKHKAREAFQNYRSAVKARHTEEDDILMRGYKHLAQGKQVIDLLDVMKKIGVNDRLCPRLAIARASWEWAWCRVSLQGGARFSRDKYAYDGYRRTYVQLPDGTFPRRVDTLSDLKARVPNIPPQFKPRGPLDSYHILWDATWTQDPPRDPILLKHLGRYVYAVLAAWDLTDLERALLR